MHEVLGTAKREETPLPRDAPLEGQLLQSADSLDIGRTMDFDDYYFDFLRDKNGQMTPEAKLFEVRDVIAKGAGEVDIVQNVRRLQAGDAAYVLAELAEFAKICRGAGVTSKVIFENCYLTREEKLLSCKIACEAGVDFVKTSTGFGTGGATLEDVQLMRAAIGPEMGLKAAGGIRTCADAFAMLRAGATRLGTSAGRAIVEGLNS